MKLGKCQKTGQEQARIWIENKKLSEHGFVPGSNFVKEWDMGETPILRLWLVGDEDEVDEWNVVSNKAGTSVIDITGWAVKQFFEGYKGYTVAHKHIEGRAVLELEGANE